MNEKIKVTGRGFWMNRLFNAEEYNGKFTWNFLFNPDDIDVFYALQRQGMKNTIRKDDNNSYVVRLSRKTEFTSRKGEVIKLEPPKVTGPNGEELDSNSNIPNGSKLEVILYVYEHSVPNTSKKAKAIRLESVKVTEFVENGNNNNNTEDKPAEYY